MKLSRREAVKIIGISIGSLFIGCEKLIEDSVTQSNKDDSESNDIALVKIFCELNFGGELFNSRYKLNKNNDNFIPAWDFAAIVNSYKILGSQKTNNTTYVFVEYEYIGKRIGDKFIIFKSKNNNRKVTFRYKVIDNQLYVKQSPIISRDIFLSTIEKDLLEIRNQINLYPENDRTHLLDRITVLESFKNCIS